MVLWRLLGPLEVRAGSGWARVQGAKPRALAAALLAEPGRVVSVDRLVGELWGDAAPPTARKLVSGYVLRLRRLTGDQGGRMLITRAPGYLLAVDAVDVDAGRFEELLATGRRTLADDEAGAAEAILAEALALWRGPALADVPRGPLATAEADRLEELRLAAVELRIEAGARCGRAAELVPELRQLTAGHPLRERFWGQLMRALAESGRPAEALAAYAQARAVIADELGADPGSDLQRLHQRILAAGPGPAGALDPATPDPATSGPVLPRPAPGLAGRPVAAGPRFRGEPLLPAEPVVLAVPRQLPGLVPHFVGRAAELRRLSASLDQATDAAATWVIGGTAGVGKTALAVHWAHQVAGRFPDGQLYLDLRGYDPEQPVTPANALAGFLRALGVDGPDIPPGRDERAALYRTLLTGRRVLVVLDNAGSGEQVRPLLPSRPPCAAVVTSRDSLAGLVVREGASRLDLGLLAPADATRLLRALIGRRAAADPATTRALAARCARLPLALRVAAELAATRPGIPLASLAAELADQQRRLDLLEAGGDPRTAVRAVFSWSYQHLEADAARTFRLIGLDPCPRLDEYAVAALTGVAPAEARARLDRLARAHLIYRAGPGRYGVHDLLRAYACELAARQDGDDECRAALTRRFDHYLGTAAAAMDTLYPGERHRRPGVPRPSAPAPSVADPEAARGWLKAELPGLVAVAAYAAARGWPSHAIRLSATLSRYLETSGHFPEAITIHTHACRAAQQAGDRAAEATALTSLGLISLRQGHYPEADGQLRHALELARDAGDQAGQARALGNLGIVAFQQGRYQQAAHHFRQARTQACRAGDQSSQASALATLAIIELRQGRGQRAAGQLRQALTLYREAGNRAYEGYLLDNLGLAELQQGRYQQAADFIGRALALARETGNRDCEAYALANLSVVSLRQGRCQQAAGQSREALVVFRDIGNRSGEAQALNDLGHASLAAGQAGQARSSHATALALARQIGDKYEQARAHDGLGCAQHAAGQPSPARRHWRRALTLYAELGVPEAGQVRARLG